MEEVEKNFIDCCHRYNKWYIKYQEVMRERKRMQFIADESRMTIQCKKDLKKVRTFLKEEVNSIKSFLKKESFYRLEKVQELLKEEFYFEELDLEGMHRQEEKEIADLNMELTQVLSLRKRQKKKLSIAL